ncbi:hypothetical protein M5689_020750 [Euphorbia peplus]|nr:hypothetical protein M5689_020750 [Euphorbia peplus]
MQSPQLQLVKCGGESFKWDKIATIQRNLRAYWPNLKGRRENERYWNYEWYKHGTCTPFGVFDYFNNTVQITRGIDLEAKLFEVGVELGYSYELLQFQSAIEETFGEELNIGTRCEKDVDDNFALVEVHFCINLKQQLMKCKVNSPGDCNKREFILYISTKKH